MPKRVVIAAEVEPNLIERLRSDIRFELAIRPDGDLAEIVRDAEVLITRTYNKVTAAVIEAATSLEVIAQGTSGTDNIDLAAARARGIEVISLPGINANAVAELVIGNMIALTRAVPRHTRELLRGEWRRADCADRHELRHHRLGIIGFGNVGSRVARLAGAFGMPIAFYDPYVEGGVGLDQLLTTSDILSLHVPLTEQTRRMIAAPQLALLPHGAIVINASRGEVLDLDAALAAEHLGGLAIDVFDPEPPARPWPDDPRLILTPHIAGCSYEAKQAAGEALYERLSAWAGRPGTPR